MNNKSLELTDEQWQTLLEQGEITIRAPKAKVEKWEPEGGPFYLACNGGVHGVPSTDGTRMFGVERQTREQAERDLPEMRLHNRLLAWRAEHDDVNDRADYTVYMNDGKAKHIRWRNGENDLGSVLMSEKAAKALCEAINEGRFDLNG